jgi:hypothetical protein
MEEIMPLRRVDSTTLTFLSTSKPMTRTWDIHLDALRDAEVGETFELQPESGSEFATDPKDGLTLRQYKVQLTKAAESLGKGIEYKEAVDEGTKRRFWTATILAGPRKRPAYKPKAQASGGQSRRGRSQTEASYES